MLQSKAGYIDARPLTASSRNHLQRTAGPYIGSFTTGQSAATNCEASSNYEARSVLRAAVGTLRLGHPWISGPREHDRRGGHFQRNRQQQRSAVIASPAAEETDQSGTEGA